MKLRPMAQGDIAAAHALSLSFNWPHRPEDWAFLRELGDGIVAEVDGRLAGTGLAFCYGPDLATIGMVIVDKALQGQGLGRQLMQALLDRLQGRTILLNATDEGAPLYQKLGFVPVGRVYQHQIILPALPAPALRSDEQIQMLAPDDAGFGAAYSGATGSDRRGLAEALQAHASVVRLCRGGRVIGYAGVRRFGRGWSLGPVLAEDQGAAKTLILHWLHRNAGLYTRIDVTDLSGLSPWLTSLGLPLVSTPQTMALGPMPATQGSVQIYALTAQALG